MRKMSLGSRMKGTSLGSWSDFMYSRRVFLDSILVGFIFAWPSSTRSLYKDDSMAMQSFTVALPRLLVQRAVIEVLSTETSTSFGVTSPMRGFRWLIQRLASS